MSFSDVVLHGGFYVFNRVTEFPISPADRIGKALWMESDGEIYISCADCGAINGLKGFKVYEIGFDHTDIEDFVHPCIHCYNCREVFWAHLRGWGKVSEETRLRKVPAMNRRESS